MRPVGGSTQAAAGAGRAAWAMHRRQRNQRRMKIERRARSKYRGNRVLRWQRRHPQRQLPASAAAGVIEYCRGGL